MSAAEHLAQSRLSGIPIDFDPRTAPGSENAAYALQAEANAIVAASLGSVAGLKIGCTTPVMRAFLGIENPAAGEIFASTIHHHKAELRATAFRKVGIECEIAVRIGVDIEPGSPPPNAADAIDAVIAAAEIVDDRYADYKTLGVRWLIADNFFNAGAVLAEPVSNWRALDLAKLEGRTMINGVEAGRGLGSSVMGHPFNALDWLINRRLASGHGITKGTICLLGSVVETKWLQAGDKVKIEIAGLGQLEIEVV